MVAYTTTYSFAKPTVGDDEDVWGGYLNGNFDTLESLLKGTTALTAINVTGNITVGGNVDGRDIAADGSKLDGIESGATADQTKSDIDALGIDAATLDSLDSTQFLRSDANDSYSGILTGGQLAQGLHPVHSGYYGLWNTTAYASNSQNYMIINAGTDTYITGNNTVYIRGGDNSSTNQLAVTTSGSTIGGNTVWHAGNDGSGSGLDADTVDGFHASRLGPTYEILNTGATAQWVKLGNFAASQTGKSCTINVVSNSGYNAQDAQNSQVLIRFKTSNNSSNQSGFYGDVQAYKTGPSASPSQVRVVQVSTTSFDIWCYFGTYTGDGSFYTVHQTDGTWTHSNSSGTPSGTYIDATINTMWHSGNDGSGSGLDADLWDGNQFSSYLNQAVLSTSSPSFAGLNINGNLNAVDNVYLASTMYHEGDTNTFVSFGTDVVNIGTGGTSRVYVDNTGVRLGDTGNGYFQPVSGNYGSIQIDGGAHTGWEGYSIGGRAVFMHNNSTTTGIYNDVNNHWLFAADNGGAANLYYNGSNKIQTTNTGANINGDLNAVDNIYVATAIYHEGDTNTYMSFLNDAIYLTAGGGNNLTIGNGYTNINEPIYNYSVYYEDYDALSGTSVTVNCDTAQAFSLTMTGNTTFTFNSVSNPWSTGFILELTGNGSTVTWPTSVDWAGGTAPDAPASGETDIYVFWTRDGGTTWYGVLSVDAAA